MRRTVVFLMVGLACTQALAWAQAGDVNKILAGVRQALGGEQKLASLRTFAASGTTTRVVNNQSSAPTDVEVAFEAPDKFMKKDVLVTLPGGATVTRTSGFNGDTPINIVDQPPAMGGQVFIRMAGPGDAAPGTTPTPEQQEQARQQQLLAARQDFARLFAGMVLPLSSYPVDFAYGGQAESPDGKADIVDLKGDGEFAVRLFIDAKTHLPLMLSWMAREPLTRTITRGGPGSAIPVPSGASVTSMTVTGGHATATAQGAATVKPMTPEEREKLARQMEQDVKEAEAKRRVVEFRIYYGDYRDVDGIKVPFRLQRSIDGKPVEETTFEKVKINGKIDPGKFRLQ